MPDAMPQKPETTAPTTGDGTPASSRQEKQIVIWPRDLNAPSNDKPDWGSDPEALRDV
jgi:hypothetical protein